MSTRLYPLLGGDEDETKVWYMLDLGMRMNFFYGDKYEIAKFVPSCCHPYLHLECTSKFSTTLWIDQSKNYIMCVY